MGPKQRKASKKVKILSNHRQIRQYGDFGFFSQDFGLRIRVAPEAAGGFRLRGFV
jgi:hypothetical protein